MGNWFLARLLLLAGVALLVGAGVLYLIFLEARWWIYAAAFAGLLSSVVGVLILRRNIAAALSGRRGEIGLFTLALVMLAIAFGYVSVQYPVRYDMTTAGLYSLSPQVETMLERLDKPVHITFFHDPQMQETVDLYRLIVAETDRVTIDFHDPMLNPAQARLFGVQFAGTAVMESEDRRIQVHGHREADIANGILRVSQGAKQLVCFLDGHGEADPFSAESHDHVEGTIGGSGEHSHGLGSDYVLHERHGIAKARHSLETVNYTVEKRSLIRGGDQISDCAVLIVAGPKIRLLDREIAAIEAYLASGGNGFSMLEPFIETGLEPVVQGYGIRLDDVIVIDEASHYWTDPSAPAVTDYNHHQVARDLPLTFFPGARALSPTTERVPGTAVVPIANSSASSFGETSNSQADFDSNIDLPGPLTLMAIANRRPPRAGDLAVTGDGQLKVASEQELPARSTGGPEITARSRIAVIGDSDFATNSFFHFLGNGDLFLNTVSYLAAQENLIGIEPRTYDLPRLSVTNRQIKSIFVIAVLLIPSILALIGVVVWWRQR